MAKDTKVVKLHPDASDRFTEYTKALDAVKDTIEDIVSVVILKDKTGYAVVGTSNNPADLAISAYWLNKEIDSFFDVEEIV
jgi:hypothetical protein